VLCCPHCHAPLTHSDLLARRLLRPRTCAACGKEYFEGGTTGAAIIVAAGGALATSLRARDLLPGWAPAGIALAAAVLGVGFTHLRAPRKISELRTRLSYALGAALLTAVLVWRLFGARR
jgi:hypothetical protein